ncbi:MAG: sialate O-acetylesterase [Oscillospiraceae bacterium]|nr:sialate O-acetylesterase [Oscillospiraceae bacterium]
MLYDFSKEKFDIIIQGGQSNAEGCGIGAVPEPFESRGEILMMENDFTVMTAREKVWGNDAVGNFVFSYADRYIKDGWLKDGRKILILLAAVGGTSFHAKQWGLQDELFLKMIDMLKTALALNPKNQVVAFLWHQGESDTENPNRDRHYNNLTALVKNIRKTAGQEKLPFIAGDFVHHWKNDNIEICKPIITAIKDVCADIENAAFVDTDGLQSNSEKTGNDDTIHFSREALYQLGNRYYAAFCDIVQT